MDRNVNHLHLALYSALGWISVAAFYFVIFLGVFAFGGALLGGSRDIDAGWIVLGLSLAIAHFGALLTVWWPFGWLISNHVRSRGGSGSDVAKLAAAWVVGTGILAALVGTIFGYGLGGQTIATIFISTVMVIIASFAHPKKYRRGWAQVTHSAPGSPSHEGSLAV